MKNLHYFTAAAAVLAFVSCGPAKQVQQTQGQQGYYAQQPQQGYYQQQYQPELTEEQFMRQEREKERNANPCKYLAENAPKNEIRAYGAGVGFDASAAYLDAEMDAKRKLVSQLYDFASEVVKSGAENIVVDPTSAQGSRITNLDFESFAEGSIAGWRTLLSKEERTPGGIIYKMCISLSLDDAIKQSINRIKNKNKYIVDIEAFKHEAENIRENYRLQNTGTNQQMQRQQADFNLQSQMRNQEFQQEQQRVQQQQQYNLQQQQQQNNYNLQQQQQQNNYQLQQQQQQNNYQLQQQQNYNNQQQQNQYYY